MRKQTQKMLAMLLLVCLFVGLLPAAMAAVPNTLYLKPSSNWTVDGARFAAYFWNEGGATGWASMSDSDGDGYYEVGVPDGMTYVIFCRMNGGTSDNSWDNKWNQTEDLMILTDGSNCFSIYEGAWDGNKDVKIGAWSTYGNVNPTNPTNPSTPTNPTDPSTPTNPSDPTTPTTPINPGDPTTPSSIQDGMTLHCWNWSFADIEKHMPQIAAQGYTAVQTSPIQQAKESTVGKGMKSHWWVYYQPANFRIDTNTSSALGTKAQFESMCKTAHQYGVKVIVDVVANHLGNKTGNDLADTLDPDIKNDSSCWHDIKKNTTNYNDRYDITQHCMAGLPDLNTSNKKVQNYALGFLKECIDAGADGFRFDGAKHIETPDDNGCASDFWPTVINGATQYAKSTRGIDLYCYGEILDSPGGGLSIGAYTKYMSVTDNSWGNSLRGSINSSNASGYNPSYHKGAAAKKLVVWAESHDTYANDSHESTYISVSVINKTWALIAARSDVMGLYFARPSNFDSQKLGEGTVTGWANTEVKAVNDFHNLFVGTTEYVAKENNIAYCERGGSGVVLVNCSGAGTSVNVKSNTMAEGTYIDTITGNTFTVSGGRISGQIGSSGIAVVYSGKAPCKHPSHDQNGTCSECGGKANHTYVNGFCSVCGVERPAISGVYYLFGWINGANYACEEDAQNLGQYKLVNGTLTTTFSKDSYVAVKSADNANWYMTDGWQGMTVTSVTLYSTTTLGETADKLYVPGGVEITFTLVDNGDGSFTLSYAPASQGCSHSWKDATCDAPKTCTKCGETEGAALGHNWTDATCDAPKTCTKCGKTEGDYGHHFNGGYCMDCGAEDPNFQIPGAPLTPVGFTLSFEDEIFVNFYYQVSDMTNVVEQGMLVFINNPGTASIAAADKIYTGSVASGSRFMNSTDGIAAKEMGDDRYYCAYVKLSNGTYAYSEPVQYSPKTYAANMLASNTASQKQKELCVAMLNYGAAAQVFFNYKTGNLMNAGLTAEQKAMVTAYDASYFKGAIAADPGKTGNFAATAGFSGKSASVSFEGAFAINYYLMPSAAVSGDMTLYIWDAAAYASEASLTTGNATAVVTAVKQSDGSYWGNISGIAAKNLDSTYYAAGVYTDASGNRCCTGVVAYSLSRYCMNNAEGSMGALAQATAMYGYYAAAYFAK